MENYDFSSTNEFMKGKEKMQKKKLIIELTDPYVKNIPNFSVASKIIAPKKTIKEPGDKIPVTKDYASNFNKDGTIKPATNLEVVRALDFDPKNVSCVQDLINNWVHYLAFGTFVAFSTAPVMLPMIRATGATGTFLWQSVTGRGQNFITLGKQLGEIMKSMPKNIPKIPGAILSTTGRFAKWLLALETFGKAGASAAAVVKGSETGGKLVRSASAAATVGHGAWGSIKVIKNSFLVALVLVIAYKGFGLDKILNKGQKLDEDLFQFVFGAIDGTINFITGYDMAVEEVALYSNSNLTKECVMTNAIASTIMMSFFVGGLAGGSQGRALYKIDDLQRLKSGDDLAVFIQGEKGLIISKFLDDVTEAIKNALNVGGKNISITDDVLKEYIQILTKGPSANDEALAFLRLNKIDDAEAFHTQAVKVYAEKEAALTAKLNQTVKSNNEAIQKVKNGEEMGQLRQIGQNLLNRSKQNLQAMNRDPRLNPGRMGSSADEIQRAKNIEAILDGARINKIGNVDSLENAATSLIELEKALVAGEITVSQAARIYSTGFGSNISKFSDELAALMNLPDDVSRLSASEKINRITQAFADLSKQSGKLDDALNLMGPQKQGRTFWQKVFNTRGNQRGKDIEKLKDAREAAKEATNEILKLNRNMSPDDLARLEQQIEKAYKAIERVGNKAGKTTLIGDAGRLVQQTAIIASTVALSGFLARHFQFDEMDDLETWQQQDLARSLAWDGVFPLAALETFYVLNKPAEWLGFIKSPETAEENFQQGLITLVENLLDAPGLGAGVGTGNPRVLKEIYEKIIFNNNNLLISKIAKMDSIDSIKIVNDFRKSKSQYHKILFSLISDFGANDKGFGLNSLSGSDKNIAYRKMWHPILINLMIANSGVTLRLNSLETNNFYQNGSEEEKIQILREKVFAFKNPEDVTENLYEWVTTFKEMIKSKKNQNLREEIIMKKNSKDQNLMLEELVKQTINENYGKGYANYPYNSHVAEEGEPAQDFIQDWKDFELALVRDESRNTAIEIAKILVKDLELFGDVLDLVGKNQSVAVEIMKKFKETS